MLQIALHICKAPWPNGYSFHLDAAVHVQRSGVELANTSSIAIQRLSRNDESPAFGVFSQTYKATTLREPQRISKTKRFALKAWKQTWAISMQAGWATASPGSLCQRSMSSSNLPECRTS